MPNPFASIVGQRRAQSLLSRSAKQLYSFGPWPTGLIDNLKFTAGEIGSLGGNSRIGLDKIPEGAVSAINNLDFTYEGTAVSRRGRKELMGIHGGAGSLQASLLGAYQESNFDAGEVTYGLVQVQNTGGQNFLQSAIPTTLVYNGFNIKAVSFIQQRMDTGMTWADSCKYNGRIYVITSYATQAISSGSRLSANPMVWTNEPNIPNGSKCFISKDRMFVVNVFTGRIFYSKATDPSTWTAPDGGFFDVGKSDGTSINAVLVVNDVMYIFKGSGVYLFTFTSDPAIDGYLRRINTYVFYDALATDDGSIYAINPLGLWQIRGNTFTLISKPVNLKPNVNSRITQVGSQLYVDNYVYDYTTGIWTYHDSIASPNSSIDVNLRTSIRIKDSSTNTDYTMTLGKTAGSFALISNTPIPQWIDYLDFLISDAHWSKPMYAIQTKEFRAGSEEWLTLRGIEMEWWQIASAPYLPTVQLKLVRTASGSDPTSPGVGFLDGNVVLSSATGNKYITVTTSSADFLVVKPLPFTGSNPTVKSLSAMIQLYSPKVVDAADVRPTDYYFAVRDLRVYVSMKLGTVNSQATVSN